MAMKSGGARGGRAAEINMTPMIDVLLVLLIIFMVAQQGLQRGLSLHVPPPETDPATAAPADRPIVLDLEAAGRYSINSQPVDAARLRETVAEIFRARPRKVIFVKAAEDVSYGEVVAAVDATRDAGVEVVGLVPRASGASLR